MAVNCKPLIDETRAAWLDRIVKCKYVMNGSTYDGVIQEKKISGNIVRFNIGITKRSDGSGQDSITRVMLIDKAGNTMATIDGSYTKKNIQGRFFRVDLILKEG